jgi:hypothetical protein
MTCRLCGLEHRGWVSCAKARTDSMRAVQTHAAPHQPEAQVEQACPETHVLTADHVLTPCVNKDRHRPGYMRDYMRARRASGRKA